MRKLMVLSLMLVIVASARAELFGDRVNGANAALRSGDIDGALNAYKNIEIENPTSDALQYNIGCAQYESAKKQAEKGIGIGEKDPFDEAHTSFEKALGSEDPKIRENAEFNAANCLAQSAKLASTSGDSNKTIAAFKTAIQSYEEFLHSHPSHEGAQTNLDHMRYLLKQMLQNPPKQQQGGGKDKQDQNQDSSQKQQQNQGGDEEKKQDKSQQQETQKDQNKPEDKQQASESKEKQTEPKEKQTAQNTQGNANQMAKENAEQSPKDNARSQKMQDHQAVEALLQSLEEQDRQEQLNMRRTRPDPRVRGDWW